MNFPIVLSDDHGIRPAGRPDECFYCQHKVGKEHAFDCVTVTKRVRIKATVTFDIEEPHYWDKKQIEFALNESTTCADNIINHLSKFRQELKSQGRCLCDFTHFQFESVVDETPLQTAGKLR